MLWKDLIDIPEEQDTFVLKLTSGIADPERTVDHYVVTDSLADRFNDALSLISDGLAVGRSGQPESQGAFLHGSFGSGKSHRRSRRDRSSFVTHRIAMSAKL